ncbi:hypothetical protein HPB47_002053, partial [Ixodes persulcatus]
CGSRISAQPPCSEPGAFSSWQRWPTCCCPRKFWQGVRTSTTPSRKRPRSTAKTARATIQEPLGSPWRATIPGRSRPPRTRAWQRANASNGTGAATPSPPSRGPGDAVLHFGEDASNRTPKTRHYFFSSWLTWKEDNYLMSILIPIACGMSAALLILCSLACIGCCRRRCRARSRRKLHRNIDPKSIRKLKTADRIKLLAASSDEEF